MKKIKVVILAFIVILLTGCNITSNTTTTTNKPTTTTITSATTSTTKTTEKVLEAGMYYVFDDNDELKFESNSLWASIFKARNNSSRTKQWYVLDSDKQEVYKYIKKNYYMYRSNSYHGVTENESRAISWAKKYSDSYVLNGWGTEFSYVGYEVITDDTAIKNNPNIRGIELMSASYVYLFSEKYNSETLGGTGLSYIEFTVEFSKAKIKYFTNKDNESSWNAYVFANIMLDNPWANCDMGIINGGWNGGEGRWQPVFNYNGTMYMPSTDVITTMEYNEEDDTYYGVDDLFFRCFLKDNKYCMYIKNITQDMEYYYEQENEQLVEHGYKSYVLLAASNCPVSLYGEVWNPRSGNSFENVIFRDVKVKKYALDYSLEEAYDYYPLEDMVSYTLVMAKDNANVKYGSDEKGKYIIMNMYNDDRINRGE